ncbi:MAG: hypothetical protein KKB20_16335 [Proteobacteria bacterium]|nr:hypothetical protein [Pseudomonadota bacterium]
MKDFTRQGICQAKKGLLFLRDCGAPATAFCSECSRPVCTTHTIPSEKGNICPECSARQTQPDEASRSMADYRARTRSYYYSRYDYWPFYYGYTHYYSDTDYRTFDAGPDEGSGSEVQEAVLAAMARTDQEEGLEPGDEGDLDDFMES